MKRFLLPLAALALSLPAAAHVTLDPPQAVAGGYLRAAFRVPHGCDGAATESLTVSLPEGVATARPMPKPGWRLTITRAPLDPPVDNGHGRLIHERVVSITWAGGPLPDEEYDEFVVMFRVPGPGGEVLHLPAVQQCSGGATASWTEIPEPGRRITDYHHPAPSLRVTPPRIPGSN
ncbi:MAG TPA: YcnI family protein [Roseomonas sp.]